MKIILITLFLVGSLFAYSDADMDGVDDKVDKCLNTPFMDLVNKDGCTKSSLVSYHHFDILVGGSYASYNTSDTYTTSIQLDYFYKNFSLTFSNSYFINENSLTSNNGVNDSYFGASYKFKPLKNISLTTSFGTILSTYNSTTNKDDYVASLSAIYYIKDIRVLGRYSYTVIGDKSPIISYQNTNSYNLGVGYYLTNKLYGSLSYKNSDSIYVDNVDIQTISFYSNYNFNLHWFSTFSYSYGLSDSANDSYTSLKLGYYF